MKREKCQKHVRESNGGNNKQSPEAPGLNTRHRTRLHSIRERTTCRLTLYVTHTLCKSDWKCVPRSSSEWICKDCHLNVNNHWFLRSFFFSINGQHTCHEKSNPDSAKFPARSRWLGTVGPGPDRAVEIKPTKFTAGFCLYSSPYRLIRSVNEYATGEFPEDSPNSGYLYGDWEQMFAPSPLPVGEGSAAHLPWSCSMGSVVLIPCNLLPRSSGYFEYLSLFSRRILCNKGTAYSVIRLSTLQCTWRTNTLHGMARHSTARFSNHWLGRWEVKANPSGQMTCTAYNILSESTNLEHMSLYCSCLLVRSFCSHVPDTS